ncbi:unnamed protein product [Callosobruchus maculatus]|uniref:Uncharacterized protein n=1 Tax=Callosobruchus maculatus TaxID=64391 RepID=A0A653CY46_CALMS|nr:unnamed protein product [Callosobruchus maculatus]
MNTPVKIVSSCSFSCMELKGDYVEKIYFCPKFLFLFARLYNQGCFNIFLNAQCIHSCILVAMNPMESGCFLSIWSSRSCLLLKVALQMDPLESRCFLSVWPSRASLLLKKWIQ